MNIGVNFFGPKKKLYYDFEGTIEKLKNIGFTSAELCIAFSGSLEPPEELKNIIPPEVIKEMSGGVWVIDEAKEKLEKVRNYGLNVISVHMFADNASPESFLEVLPKVKLFGVENNIKCFVISLMKNSEEIKTFIPALKKFSEELSDAGIVLAYHNHEIEFENVNGVNAMELVLNECPLLKLELDVGWAKFAGVDFLDFIGKYKDRIVLLHFKDITADACAENRDTCFTAVGEGSIQLKEIIEAVDECNLFEDGMIIDQDDSQSDILDDLSIGVNNILTAVNKG